MHNIRESRFKKKPSMLLLLLFAIVAATDGPDIAHCDGASDVKQLRAYAEPGAQLPAPKTRLVQLGDDAISLSLTLPHVPARQKYKVAFGGQITPCSSLFDSLGVVENSEFDTSDDPDTDPWLFAPNANYPGALSGRYSASYVSNQTIWSVAAVDCAHVVYTTVLSFQSLARCQDTAAVLRVGDAYALLATLSVESIVPSGKPTGYRYTYELSAYVDLGGNSLVLFESSAAKSNVALKQLLVSPEKMSLRFQTASTENLQLSSIAARDRCNVALHRNSTGVPPSYSHRGLLIQNWDFYGEATKTCHFQFAYEAADFVSTIDAFLSVDTSPPLSASNIAEIHSAVAQHKPAEAVAHEGGFVHGERVCMQSYLLLPEHVQVHAEVLMLAAWLCPDDQETSCANHTHAVLLYENGRPMRPDVTLISPGAYGPCSVALCFNATATMVDRNRATVIRTEQRYESFIALHALKSSARELAASFFDANTRETPKALQQRALFVESLHQTSFTGAGLEQSVRAARASDLLVNHEEQVYRFVVEPSEDLVHNISTYDAVVIILLVTAVSIAVVICYALFVLRRNSVARGDQDFESKIERHWQN